MRILQRTLVALLLAVCAGGVSAQAYPSKPVRFVVPYPPGGSNDVLTRITAQAMPRASVSRSSSTTGAVPAA